MVKTVSTNEPTLVKSITNIENEAFGEGGLNDWTLVPLIRHGRVFITTQQGKILGSAQYMRDWNRLDRAYLVGLSIDAGYRGQGIGTDLLAQSISELAKEGIREVELTVDPANKAAVQVYQRKLGFAVVESRANEYGAGEHRLVMRRRI